MGNRVGLLGAVASGDGAEGSCCEGGLGVDVGRPRDACVLDTAGSAAEDAVEFVSGNVNGEAVVTFGALSEGGEG